MTRTVLSFVTALIFCARPAPPERTVLPEQRSEGARCRIEPGVNCGAGDLPRLTERDWPRATIEQFVQRTKRGTVAVERSEGGTSLSPDCKLDGKYTEVRGEPKSARFWATNRSLLLYDEVGPNCAGATHVVVAFALSSESDAGAFRFSAVLIPLPCPSVSDPMPAKGCLGKGLSGPQRLERAQQIMKVVRPDDAYRQKLSALFEVYALIPDDRWGLGYLAKMRGQDVHDCTLEEQINWALRKYALVEDARGGRVWQRRENGEAPAPISISLSQDSCLTRPPFLSCFPGLFTPSEGGGCWAPAEPTP
jgi:hypothetical protein